ncbi:MAG: hypothetical protein WD278_13390 [Pirellulales bacterium]
MSRRRRRQAAGNRGPRRSRAKERFWRGHLARQAAGAFSIRAYCERHSLAEPSFYAWRRELARRDRAASADTSRAVVQQSHPAMAPGRGSSPLGFVRLNIGPELPSPSASIEIVLSGELRVLVPPGAGRGQVREVLAALGVVSDGEPRPC